MPADISEAASEKQKPLKRGRPPAFCQAQMNFYKGLFPEIRTRRGLQDRAYALQAYDVLKDDRGFEWLCSTPEKINASTGELQFSILGALGRITDPEALKAVAREVCRLKPSARRAVVMIRRWRTGKVNVGNCLTLGAQLERCINDYLAAHPRTPWRVVKVALANVLESVFEVAEQSAEET